MELEAIFIAFFYTTNSNSKKHFKNETTLPSSSVTEGIWDFKCLRTTKITLAEIPHSFSQTYTAIKPDTILIPWDKYFVLPEFVYVFTFNQRLKT